MPTQVTYTPDNDDIPELPIDLAAVLAAAQAQRSVAQSASVVAQTKANEAALSASDSAFRAGEAAASAASAAATILTYYGPLAADPATRPGGAARVTGDMYYSTTTTKLRIFNGTAWFDAAVSAIGTAATKNTGTSGNNVPLLDGDNTWSKGQTISGALDTYFNMDVPATKFSGLRLSHAGALKWSVLLNADESLYFWDYVGGMSPLTMQSGGTTILDAKNGTVVICANGAEIMRSNPTAVAITAGKYLNWGVTYESAGYGLRDNAGVIEVKNSGGAWAPIPTSGALRFAVRQTVSAGPVDTGGLPTLFPATSASLSITTQNVSSTVPLVATAAQGFGATGQVDYASQFTANQTWSSLTANSTLYLYVNAQTGALGFTALLPIYQHGGTPATTNGQFTFNISEMKGYLGNGTTAPATPIVFVGEVVTNATTVTSAEAYAYNGRYDSGWTQNLPGTSAAVVKNSNLGVHADSARLVIECTTADGGYAVGEQALNVMTNGTLFAPPLASLSRNAVSLVTSGTSAFQAFNKSTNVYFVLTSTSWRYKFSVSRGW